MTGQASGLVKGPMTEALVLTACSVVSLLQWPLSSWAREAPESAVGAYGLHGSDPPRPAGTMQHICPSPAGGCQEPACSGVIVYSELVTHVIQAERQLLLAVLQRQAWERQVLRAADAPLTCPRSVREVRVLSSSRLRFQPPSCGIALPRWSFPQKTQEAQSASSG